MNIPDWTPLANHLWQATLCVAAAWLLTLAFGRNRAAVRYWIWLAASVKFLIPFAWLADIGGRLSWRTETALPQPRLAVTIEELTRPLGLTIAPVRISGIAPPPAGLLEIALLVVWLCGIAVGVIFWFRWWRQMRAIHRTATPLALDLPIPAMVSSARVEPGVFGIRKPVLLLPDRIAERLTASQWQAVLAHELFHVRRRDNLTAAIHMVVETVFWFHPMVWWIRTRLLAERERACDEEVLRLGCEPEVYAEGILNVCRMYVQSPLPCVSGVTGGNLKERIDAILANRVVPGLSLAQKAVLVAAALAAVALPLAIGLMHAPPIHAQSAAAPVPKFEVASIKPCKDEPGRMRGPGDSSPGRLSTGCSVLVDANYLGLIQRAYVRFAGGHTNPMGILAIEGGPGWIHSAMYQINARAEGKPSLEMMQGPMLQALLENRFKLKIRRETREGPVYELTMARGGPKLKPFQEGRCTQMPLTIPMPALAPGQKYCKALVSLRSPAVQAEGSTLGEFSKLMTLVMDRPVIDKTGISGRFDMHVEFSADSSTPGVRGPFPGPVPEAVPAASDPTGPTIFAALQEQLGLRLVPAKGPIERLVIDRIERPSPN